MSPAAHIVAAKVNAWYCWLIICCSVAVRTRLQVPGQQVAAGTGALPALRALHDWRQGAGQRPAAAQALLPERNKQHAWEKACKGKPLRSMSCPRHRAGAALQILLPYSLGWHSSRLQQDPEEVGHNVQDEGLQGMAVEAGRGIKD